MRLIETLKNIWKVEELRQRILTTLFFVLIYRLGSYIVIPGIDPNHLTALQSQTREGLMALLDMFSGGAFSNASVFALGIMPYISASIVMQLAAIVVPSIQKLQQEGESGRRKIDQWTRYLTVLAGCGSTSTRSSSWRPVVCSSSGWVSASRIRASVTGYP